MHLYIVYVEVQIYYINRYKTSYHIHPKSYIGEGNNHFSVF